MANVNAPFGFKPLRRLDGAMWNDKYTLRLIQNGYAAAVYRGDVVKSNSSGYVTRAAAGDQVAGVFFGCQYYDNTAQRTVWSNFYPASAPATGDITSFIIDDPNVEFEAQLSGAIAGFHVGVNANILAAAPASAGAGLSAESIDSASFATTSTLQFRCLGFLDRVDNDAASSFARVRVAFNNSDFKTLTGV